MLYFQEALSSISRIPNFELQVYMVYGQYVVLIDMAGFNSGSLSDSANARSFSFDHRSYSKMVAVLSKSL